MTTFISNFKKLATAIFCTCISLLANAQQEGGLLKRVAADTSHDKMNMDAVFNRPFLTVEKTPLAIGGYLEANTQYASTDGVSEGLSFQMRRMTLFFSSTLARKIKFFSELEFEEGTKEINLEYAAVDVEFHPLLNLCGGIIMNPIGGFNQNHDGPRWDFIDRPISSTTIIPSTLSNAGLGLHGKYFANEWIFGYEAYLTNGFDDKIIANEDNRTSLAAGKSSPEKFEESFNGVPMFTGKLAVRNRKIGEIGLSYLTDVYNKFEEDGLMLDEKRKVRVVAVDFNTSQLDDRLNITGEMAKVVVDVPETYSQAFGKEQFGGFVDVVGTVFKGKILDWEKAKINLCLRLEYADYNQGKFRETGGKIADEVWALVPGISFRPVGNTVLRFNYRYQLQKDLLGNPAAKTGVVQFGVSSYF